MYKNIFVDKKEMMVYLWDDKHGLTTFPYSRYAYRRKVKGEYKSLYGDELEKIYNFDDTDPTLFESDVLPEVRVLIDAYEDSDEPSIGHKVVIIDIEVSTDGGFPDVSAGDKPITAIALFDQVGSKYYSLILDPDKKITDSDKDGKSIKSYNCEERLLESFLNLWETIHPTIVSGWNTNHFDLPYLFNRIRAVLGKNAGYKLSPIGIAYQNKFNKKMTIAGISCLDYIELYKKFIGVMKPSWSLSNVAKDEELKTQKLTYKGNLNDLYKNDLHRYVEYNLTDVMVVVELDKKYDFIHLACSVCHKGHVPYEWFQMSSRFIDGAILMYLKRHNLVAPNKPIGGREEYEEMVKAGEEGFEGAYVKEPVPGLYDWIYSADITSLYPSVIMSLNVSPETKICKIEGWDKLKFDRGEIPSVNIKEQSYSAQDFTKMIEDHKFSISSNGVVYRQDVRGVVPIILDTWFKERVEYRELASKYGKDGNKEKEEFYDRRQKRQKIFLNCFTGDTSVMTLNGECNIKDLKCGDLIYSLNPSTEKIEIKPVTKTFEYPYNGNLIKILNQHVDYLVTPNHKFLVNKLNSTNKSYKWIFAEEFIKMSAGERYNLPKKSEFPGTYDKDKIYLHEFCHNYNIPHHILNGKIRSDRTSHCKYQPNEFDTNDWLEFVGWYISEGSLYESKEKIYENGNHRGITKNVYIAQEKYHLEVKTLLDRMKILYYESKKGFQITGDIIYDILLIECGKSSYKKMIPPDLFFYSTSRLKSLFYGLFMGDGDFDLKRYRTVSLQLAKDVRRLCLHLGKQAYILKKSENDCCYTIQVNDCRGISPCIKHSDVSLETFNGSVFCVEVEDNHTLLCGRNGLFNWCGQSVYGVLGLPVSRWYDRDNAESTTISGQTIIVAAEKLANEMYAEKFKARGVVNPEKDFVIYIDTDSVYLSSLPLAKLESEMPDMTKFTISVVTEVAAKINRLYEYMIPKIFNVAPKYNRIKIVPDVIAKKALWVKKKRYAMLKVWDMEKNKAVKDKNGNEGKLEVKGIDSVRSSFPASFRKFAGETLDSILRGIPQSILDEKIMVFEETIDQYSIYDLSKTSSVKFISTNGEMNYNPKERRLFQFIQGSPAQVRAALAYNDFLKVWKLDKQFEKINSSSKVKWAYLLPNEFNIDQLAIKADDTDPDQILEFVTTYIDRNKMYEQELRSKLSKFYEAIGWKYPNRGSQLASKIFNFDDSW